MLYQRVELVWAYVALHNHSTITAIILPMPPKIVIYGYREHYLGYVRICYVAIHVGTAVSVHVGNTAAFQIRYSQSDNHWSQAGLSLNVATEDSTPGRDNSGMWVRNCNYCV
jgi:hypothetical protein